MSPCYSGTFCNVGCVLLSSNLNSRLSSCGFAWCVSCYFSRPIRSGFVELVPLHMGRHCAPPGLLFSVRNIMSQLCCWSNSPQITTNARTNLVIQPNYHHLTTLVLCTGVYEKGWCLHPQSQFLSRCVTCVANNCWNCKITNSSSRIVRCTLCANLAAATCVSNPDFLN